MHGNDLSKATLGSEIVAINVKKFTIQKFILFVTNELYAIKQSSSL